MKSSTLVLWCSALLNVSWGQTLGLLLLAPPKSMDQAKVMAKKDSDGEPIVMSRATDDHESRPLCATDVFTMSLDCNEENRYHEFATTNFAHPTDLPRPLTLTMPDYTLHCDISVKVIEGTLAIWYVGWGLNKWAGNPDNMGITCTNTTDTT